MLDALPDKGLSPELVCDSDGFVKVRHRTLRSRENVR